MRLRPPGQQEMRRAVPAPGQEQDLAQPGGSRGVRELRQHSEQQVAVLEEEWPGQLRVAPRAWSVAY